MPPLIQRARLGVSALLAAAVLAAPAMAADVELLPSGQIGRASCRERVYSSV